MKRFLLPILALSSLLVLAGCDDSSSNSRSVSLAETLGGKTFHADLSAGTTSKAVASDADLEDLYFTFANNATTVEVVAVYEDHSSESETAPVTQNDDGNARFESSTGLWSFEIDPESRALNGNHGAQAVSCNMEKIGSVGPEYEYTGKEYYGLSDNKCTAFAITFTSSEVKYGLDSADLMANQLETSKKINYEAAGLKAVGSIAYADPNWDMKDDKSFSITLHGETYSCRFIGPDLIRVENPENSALAYFLKRNQDYPGSST